MARGAAEPSTKRAKVDEAEEKEDPLVRRKEEVVRLLEEARAKGEDNARAKKELVALCADFEAKNEKLLGRLPPELWQKILDENLHQNDLLALSMTCRFFREKQKVLGKKVETNLYIFHLPRLRKSGKMPSHTLGWFRWVCDTFEILSGYETRWSEKRVKGAVYECDLLNYAMFQGGSVEVLEYLGVKGYEFNEGACEGAAEGGCLKALKWLRAQDPPCPWNGMTCILAALGGHLDVLKWLRSQDPPCPLEEYWPCAFAANGGHLEVLKWLLDQDPPCDFDAEAFVMAARGGNLEVLKWLKDQAPSCYWCRRECREEASQLGHQHIVDWIDQQTEDESSSEEYSDGD
ncbi:putative ankyrin repeat protein [Chloropicon roscoffensis]|uniref:Ankyrin repeat protein n=1 Tax=Chloropicon roscoffensis TaxID=1461544 RepID=A0AAX4PJJ3_9CHLO